MKKLIIFTIVFCMLFVLVGCQESIDYSNAEVETARGYVVSVMQRGFIVDFGQNFERVYVKYDNARDMIACFDTVTVEYYDIDFVERSGIYFDFAGYTEYTHRINNPIKVSVVEQTVPGVFD